MLMRFLFSMFIKKFLERRAARKEEKRQVYIANREKKRKALQKKIDFLPKEDLREYLFNAVWTVGVYEDIEENLLKSLKVKMKESILLTAFVLFLFANSSISFANYLFWFWVPLVAFHIWMFIDISKEIKSYEDSF